jgi:hypothetical protein
MNGANSLYKSASPEVVYNTRRLLKFVSENVLFNIVGFVMAQMPPVRSRTTRRRREATTIPSWVVVGLIGLFVVATALTAYLVANHREWERADHQWGGGQR